MAKFLFLDQTEDDAGSWVGVNQCFDRADQSNGFVYIGGTRDGDTVTFYVRPKGVTGDGVAIEDGAFTTNVAKEHALSPDLEIRAALTGAGAGTEVTVWIG